MKNKKQSLINVLFDEVVQGTFVGEDDSNYLIKEQRIVTFINIPRELEKILYLGYLVCLDAFLFLFTFLPIRSVCAVWKILVNVVKRCLFLTPTPVDKGLICDLFRLTMITTCLFCLSFVNISMLYHIIRGQSVIKLYFIYNVLEIMDYLCLSFGNDVMDALFWLTIRNKVKKREHVSVLWHWVLGCAYTIIHSICFLIQAICLSVAINSYNKTLVVVMTSNQFMELKSYLFKKFDKENNYQIVARDIRERFQYTIIIAMVLLRNMSQLDWDTAHMWDVMPDVVLIMSSEIAIDWIKHAFVTKFNGIPVESYRDYRYQLYDDLLNPKFYNQTFSNRMDSMARKILFIPMPLACLTVTVLIEVIPEDLQLTLQDYVVYTSLTISTLFVVKVINMGLIIHNAEKLRRECPIYTRPVIPPIRNVNSSVKLPVPTMSPGPDTPVSLTHISEQQSRDNDVMSRDTDPLQTSSPSSTSTLSPDPLLRHKSSSILLTNSSTESSPYTSPTPPADTPPVDTPPISPVSGGSSPVSGGTSPVSGGGLPRSTGDMCSGSPTGDISPATGDISPTSSSTSISSPDIENEPPLDNISHNNININENLLEEQGLRKRVVVKSESCEL